MSLDANGFVVGHPIPCVESFRAHNKFRLSYSERELSEMYVSSMLLGTLDPRVARMSTASWASFMEAAANKRLPSVETGSRTHTLLAGFRKALGGSVFASRDAPANWSEKSTVERLVTAYTADWGPKWQALFGELPVEAELRIYRFMHDTHLSRSLVHALANSIL